MAIIDIIYAVLIVFAVIWGAWFAGYPIYTKISKRAEFDWNIYSLGLCSACLIMNILNIAAKIITKQ